MAINRDDLKRMIDGIEPDYLDKVYQILLVFTDDEKWVADNSPLTDEEKKALEKAEHDIANGDLVDWEEIKRELDV